MSHPDEPTFTPRSLARAAAAVAALLLVGLIAFIVAGRIDQIDTAKLKASRPPAASSPTPVPTPLDDIARADLTSVVTVEAQLPSEESLGTAWLFDAKGDFVTNAHVVAGQLTIRITDRQNHSHLAVVLGVDQTADIALLRATGGFAGTPLPVDTVELKVVPMAVVALASSRATGQVDLTADTLVELNQDVPLSNGGVQPGQSAPTIYHNMLHLAGARIYEGNSGGPVLGPAGLVIGIVTLASPSNPDAYAIPITRVLAELLQFARRNG